MATHPQSAPRPARRRRRGRAPDALPGRPAPTTAFAVQHVAGTADQLALLRNALASAALTPAEARTAGRFLVHILASADREGDGFVPVPAKLIERSFRGLDWRYLEDLGLVEDRPYSREAGRCREFAVASGLRRAFYEAGPTAARVARDGLYDLVKGRPTTRRVKSDRRTASGNALPPLVRAAIDAFGETPVDVHAVERHLARLREAVDALPDGPTRVAAEGRYLNDLRCYQAVLSQGARPLDAGRPDGLWLYRPAYLPQRFGRISQKGGGLQSCSGAMKAVAYPETYP